MFRYARLKSEELLEQSIHEHISSLTINTSHTWLNVKNSVIAIGAQLKVPAAQQSFDYSTLLMNAQRKSIHQFRLKHPKINWDAWRFVDWHFVDVHRYRSIPQQWWTDLMKKLIQYDTYVSERIHADNNPSWFERWTQRIVGWIIPSKPTPPVQAPDFSDDHVIISDEAEQTSRKPPSNHLNV